MSVPSLEKTLEQRIEDTLNIAFKYAQIDGAHHKAWVIDQMVFNLIGSQKEYDRWVKEYCDGEHGPDTYEWDKGIAP